jgi:CRP-like cAMP-binding protein
MAKSCIDCDYRANCIARDLAGKDLQNFSDSLHRFSVRGKHRVLFNQGEPVDRSYFLCAGAVKVVRMMPDGDEVIVDVAAAFSVLGKGQLLLDSDHVASIVTISETVDLSYMQTAVLMEFLQGHARTLERFLILLAEKIQKLYKMLACMKLPMRKRLLTLIALLLPVDGAGVIDVPLTSIELAQLAQTTPETISRTVQRLRAEGTIARVGRGRISIRKSILREHLAQLS